MAINKHHLPNLKICLNVTVKVSSSSLNIIFSTHSCLLVNATKDCTHFPKRDIKTARDFNHYLTRLVKDQKYGFALDEMDRLKTINIQTEEKMVVLRCILCNLGKTDLGTNRQRFTKLQKWYNELPTAEATLRGELA